jgi:mono/diheme cytochrome c family protein
MVPLMKITRAVRAFRARPVSVFAVVLTVTALGHALVVGCGGKSNQSGQQPSPTPGTGTPGATASATPGAKIYADRCALCHGAEGKGDGTAAAALDPKPRNHTDGSYMNAHSDAELLAVIRDGKGAMPAWKSVLSEEDIQAVLKHVRTLAQPPYPG